MRRSYLILGVIGVVVVVGLARYFSTGTITVVTGGAGRSTITLQKTSQGGTFNKTGIGSLSATVGHGQYMATVKNGSHESVQIINFGSGHRSFHFSITPAASVTASTVINQNSSFLAADTQLAYLNPGSNFVFRVGPDNSLARVSSTQQFQAVKWASSSYGVGQDSSGHLYSIIDGSVKPLDLPFAYGKAEVSYDIAPNKELYVSNGADVYRGRTGESFQKIYAAPSAKLMLAASSNAVAIAPDANAPAASPWIISVSSSGKALKKSGGTAAERLSWSPDGTHLVSVGNFYISIYDSSLHLVSTLPTSSFAGYIEGYVGYVAWASSDMLVYTSSTQVWRYQLSSERVDLLSTMPLNDSIQGVTVGSNESGIYVADSGPDGANAIRRVSLTSQSGTTPDVFPIQLHDCSLELIDFTNPGAIEVRPSPDSNLPAASYLQEAAAALQQYGIDPAKFRLVLVSAASD